MTRTTLQETLEKTGILVIDGSMSTALEQLGIESLDELPDLAPLLPDVESIESDY